jgi:ribonucleoside-diphosphate reductase alpha chain
LDDTYKLAWLRGLKTTYYLRTTSASHVEMSTVQRSGTLNAVKSHGVEARAAASAPAASATASVATTSPVLSANAEPASDIKFCAIDDPSCEACQ